MKDLKETVALMTSADYKERFQAEYYQVAIRYAKLNKMVEAWDKGELTFTPTCPREIYDRQLSEMGSYLSILEERAKLENVELNFDDKELSLVQNVKLCRRNGDSIIQQVKQLDKSRETSLAITKFQEGVMWLGMELKRLNETNPYPSSKDPSTGDKIESTADGLKL